MWKSGTKMRWMTSSSFQCVYLEDACLDWSELRLVARHVMHLLLLGFILLAVSLNKQKQVSTGTAFCNDGKSEEKSS